MSGTTPVAWPPRKSTSVHAKRKIVCTSVSVLQGEHGGMWGSVSSRGVGWIAGACQSVDMLQGRARTKGTSLYGARGGGGGGWRGGKGEGGSWTVIDEEEEDSW